MNRNSFIIYAAAAMAVTLPYWTALPWLVEFAAVQAMSGIVVYFLEVFFMIAVLMSVIEGRIRLIMGASALGFVLGAVPGIGIMPMTAFLPTFLKLTIPPIVMGLLINHGFTAWKSFVVSALLMAVFVLMIYFQSSQALAESDEQIRASIVNMVNSMLGSGGYSTETIDSFVDQLYLFVTLLIRLLPALIILSGVGQLFAAFLLTEWYFTRRDSYFPGFGPFIYWKIPEKLLYLLGLVLIVRLTVGGGIEQAADNAALILFVGYSVCGLALIEHFLRRLRLPILVRVVFYLGLTFMHIPGIIITSLAGLFDSYFDFRKVRAHTLG